VYVKVQYVDEVTTTLSVSAIVELVVVAVVFVAVEGVVG